MSTAKSSVHAAQVSDASYDSGSSLQMANLSKLPGWAQAVVLLFVVPCTIPFVIRSLNGLDHNKQPDLAKFYAEVVKPGFDDIKHEIKKVELDRRNEQQNAENRDRAKWERQDLIATLGKLFENSNGAIVAEVRTIFDDKDKRNKKEADDRASKYLSRFCVASHLVNSLTQMPSRAIDTLIEDFGLLDKVCPYPDLAMTVSPLDLLRLLTHDNSISPETKAECEKVLRQVENTRKKLDLDLIKVVGGFDERSRKTLLIRDEQLRAIVTRK